MNLVYFGVIVDYLEIQILVSVRFVDLPVKKTKKID